MGGGVGGSVPGLWLGAGDCVYDAGVAAYGT